MLPLLSLLLRVGALNMTASEPTVQKPIIQKSDTISTAIAYNATMRKGMQWTNPEKEFCFEAIIHLADTTAEITVSSFEDKKNSSFQWDAKQQIERNLAHYLAQKAPHITQFSLSLLGKSTEKKAITDTLKNKSEWRGLFEEAPLNN